METKSMNVNTEKLIDEIYDLIDNKVYDEAENKVRKLELITDVSNKDVLRANMLIRKGKML
jgi:hypothetical protein